MNTTRSSKLSQNLNKKTQFRVVLRHRTDSRYQSQQEYNKSTQQSRCVQQNPQKTFNRNEIKDFIRENMKTDMKKYQDKQKIPDKSYSIQIGHNNEEKDKNISSSDADKSLIKNSRITYVDNLSVTKDRFKQKDSSIQALCQIEAKINKILQKRLDQCLTHKKQRSKQIEQQLANQLSALQKIDQSSVSTDEAISIKVKKIELFEKIMAESMVQSEIMKKFFLNKISNRPKHSRVQSTRSYSNSRIQFQQSQKQKQVIISISSNRDSFKTPIKQSYKIYKHKQRYFNADRHKQPFHRSSYNRQFLLYDPQISKPIRPINNIFLGNSKSNISLTTSYKQSFIPKNIENTNIKQLDAYKNKIKKLDVTFYNKQSNKVSSDINHFCDFKLKSPAKQQINNKFQDNIKFSLSESRRQYKNTAGQFMISKIKHENMSKMFHKYRLKTHA